MEPTSCCFLVFCGRSLSSGVRLATSLSATHASVGLYDFPSQHIFTPAHRKRRQDRLLWLPTVLAGLLLCFELPLLLLALPLLPLLRAAAAAPLTARTVAIARGRRPTFAGLLLCFELPLLLLLPLLRAAAAATLTALLGGDNGLQQERAGYVYVYVYVL